MYNADETSPVIALKNVDLFYRIHLERVRTLKGLFLSGFQRKNRFRERQVLRQISLKVFRGEALGITGPNGAGKSTLFKVIARVLKPTWGSVEVQGSLSPLIELCAGFEAELTGRENIHFGGSIYGMTKKEIREALDFIIDFSGLEEHIDEPVRAYSSGMLARLGFSLAISSNPSILLVDEVLAVGDAEFMEKCLNYMRVFLKKGGTLLLISHNLDLIREIATRHIILENGKIVHDKGMSLPPWMALQKRFAKEEPLLRTSQ